jgi:N-acetylglutamate synthase-like GNAT family acetyltransferase
MTDTQYRVRRATTDDVPSLMVLWRAAHLPVDELEKRFTEFQLIESADGVLAGSIGLQMIQQQGKIHSETFADFGQADVLRPLLWKRLQSVAQNNGLFRFWTQETAPFWKQNGFTLPDKDVLAKLLPVFGDAKSSWLSIQLKDENALPDSIEAEFAKFRDAEKANTEKLKDRARVMKLVAASISVLLFIALAVCFFYLFKHKQQFIR